VGVPPEEGDYWEPDPGPADGYGRLGCAAIGGRETLELSGRIGSRVSVSGGVEPGVYDMWLVPPEPLELRNPDHAVSAYLTYLPGGLAVSGAYVWSYAGTARRLRVMDEEFNVLLEAGPAEYVADGWLELGLNGSLTLDAAATYWLVVRHSVMPPVMPTRSAITGPASNAPYSAWVATEDYHYCDYVAYPVPDAGRHVLPLLKRATLGEGTLIPGGASLCR